MNYDIVLVAHEKDFNNLKYIIRHAEQNLNFDSIHLILSERSVYKDEALVKTLTTRPVYIHNEVDVLKIDKSRLKHRPNWIYQMFLKMFQDVTKNDNFLIIESDCIILSRLQFFESNKTTFFLCRDQNHQPYFNFSRKILGIGRELNHSFISEFMMYDKKKVNAMIKAANCNSKEEFLELLYENVTPDCYPADYEMYGNFCCKTYPSEFQVKKIDFGFFGRSAEEKPEWDDNEIETLIYYNANKPVFSFHTWGAN